MFRQMRRSGQQLADDAALALLTQGEWGVLAVAGDDGYPYAVALNYAYEDGCLYFHCAKEGHKLDGIKRDERVSFFVVNDYRNVPHKFTAYFKSVMVFGRAAVVEKDTLKRHALELLVKKFSPAFIKEGEGEIDDMWERVHVLQLKIEHMTAKEANNC